MNVYDFDNTIYDGESGFDIFMFYLKKDPKEIAKLIPRFGEAFIRFWKIKIPALQSQVPGFLYCHVNTIIRCHDRISYSKFIFRISVLQYFDYSESRSEVPSSVSSVSATSEASLESDESSFFDLNFSASASLLLRSSSSLASRSAFFGSQRRQSA